MRMSLKLMDCRQMDIRQCLIQELWEKELNMSRQNQKPVKGSLLFKREWRNSVLLLM